MGLVWTHFLSALLHDPTQYRGNLWEAISIKVIYVATYVYITLFENWWIFYIFHFIENSSFNEFVYLKSWYTK